ncbi:hypothetical protein BD324DRAFT_274146 [Kockovaella imperatae]|uniref:DUF4185 domain-containing protein n=1 Tax=Kockovaella imperatae TaxID=4999 RepID=A0A1Y1URS8_9TREE|nr:hypothetical protein BD324DRAFT_274146 [Kockovaella imperatae]ORX40327.1 hypothetical protein BD324DRAFT_274146 [Kockovaella imperatae]
MLSTIVASLFAASAVLASPTTAPAQNARTWATPGISSFEKVAITIEPNYQRDSCVSASTLVDGRVLWICRDTIPLKNGTLGTVAGFYASSASWSDQLLLVAPKLDSIPPEQGQKFVTTGYQYQLTQYGGDPITTPYLPFGSDLCAPGGGCANGTRIIEWPDAAAFVTHVALDGTTIAYLYTTLAVQGFGDTDNEPATTLYKITYTPNLDRNVLPTVEIVNERFFPRVTYNYGSFGGVIGQDDGLLYLWGQTYNFGNGNTSIGLARVDLAHIEDMSAYQYYYPANNTWSSNIPSIYDPDAKVDIGGFGPTQGTFYYSELYQKYLFVGQSELFAMEVSLTSASQPEGPWTPYTAPVHLPDGDYISYSFAAHPEMSVNPAELYVSYTQTFTDNGTGVFEQPLYKLNLQL